MFETRQYNKPALVKYEGKLIKNRNKSPTVDEKFLQWCVGHSKYYSSYVTMGKDLGLDSRCLARLMKKNGISLIFDPLSPCAPKLYQDKEWLYNQCIELGKTNRQIAEENGWTERVVMKWVDLYGLHLRNYKNLKTLTPLQEEVVIGSILGDGHIAKNRSFIISHNEEQKDYLYWKYEILQSVCKSAPTYYPGSFKKIKGKECWCRPCYRFNTRLLTELGVIDACPLTSIIENLTPLQFSIWMLDDGSRQKCRWQLCIAPYTEEEKRVFVVKMNEWGFNLKIHSGDNRYADFNAMDAKRIDAIILNNIPNNLDIIQNKILIFKEKEVLPL